MLAIVSSPMFQLRLVLPHRVHERHSFLHACSQGHWYIRSVFGQTYCDSPGQRLTDLPSDVLTSLNEMKEAVHWVKTGEMVQYGRAGQLQHTRKEIDLNLHQAGKQFHTILPSTPGWDGIENDTLRPNQWWTRAEISQLATAGGLDGGRTIGILNPMMRTITMHAQVIPLVNLDCIFVDADVDYSVSYTHLTLPTIYSV